MFITSFTPQSIWSSTTRTLTGFGSAIAIAGASNNTLAASASIAISSPATTGSLISVGLKAGAAGSFTASMGDGINLFLALTVATATNGCLPAYIGQAGVNLTLKNNDAANSGTYTVAQVVLQQ